MIFSSISSFNSDRLKQAFYVLGPARVRQMLGAFDRNGQPTSLGSWRACPLAYAYGEPGQLQRDGVRDYTGYVNYLGAEWNISGLALVVITRYYDFYSIQFYETLQEYLRECEKIVDDATSPELAVMGNE